MAQEAGTDGGGDAVALRMQLDQAEQRIRELEATREMFQKQRDDIVADRDRVAADMKRAVDSMAVTAEIERTPIAPGDFVLIRIKEAKTAEALDGLKKALSWVVRRFPRSTFAVIAPDMAFSIEKMSEPELRALGLINAVRAEAGIPVLEAAVGAYQSALERVAALLDELAKLPENTTNIKTGDCAEMVTKVRTLLTAKLTHPAPESIQAAHLQIGKYREALEKIRDRQPAVFIDEANGATVDCLACKDIIETAGAVLPDAPKEEGQQS